uniref:Uncharacterized protein n=1 Tax=Lactuca sativa TaxID=4236 RepID=A0A9R1W981_LACSA|nr:hypothetical protein LSAT_V11C200071540 [Lactuca sativa]
MVRLQNRPICGLMFRQSCFGDYVNMLMGVECHPLLCHYLMFKEVTTFDPIDLKELLFPVGDYQVCFDKKAFCFVTGLRFGDYFHPSSSFAEFRERVFPFVSISRSIWILKTFPNNSIVGSPISGVILRAVTYPRMRCLHAFHCQRILDVTNVCTLVHLIIYNLL